LFRCQCSDLRVQVHQEQTPCPLEVLMHRIHSNHNKGGPVEAPGTNIFTIQGKKSQKFDPRWEVGWFLDNVGCLTCAEMTTTAIGRSTLSTQPLSVWSVLPCLTPLGCATGLLGIPLGYFDQDNLFVVASRHDIQVIDEAAPGSRRILSTVAMVFHTRNFGGSIIQGTVGRLATTA